MRKRKRPKWSVVDIFFKPVWVSKKSVKKLLFLADYRQKLEKFFRFFWIIFYRKIEFERRNGKTTEIAEKNDWINFKILNKNINLKHLKKILKVIGCWNKTLELFLIFSKFNLRPKNFPKNVQKCKKHYTIEAPWNFSHS